MVYVFLADGFEETEAIAPIDLLRRANIQVVTVGVGKQQVTSAHGIPVLCDKTIDSISSDLDKFDENLEMVFLPGGGIGTKNLEASPDVQKWIDYAVQKDLWVAAICAAPSILGHKGLLDGKKATCYPGFEPQLGKADATGLPVVVDGKIITGKGAGVAIQFGLKLVECLRNPETARDISESIQCPN